MIARALLLLFIACGTEAHRSLPDGVTCGSQFTPTAPLTIPNPKISWASYHIHTCDHPVFWLQGDFTKDQNIFFTVGVPKLTRFKDARMTTVLLGPGLPLTADTIDPDGSKKIPKEVIDELRASGLRAKIFESPADQSNCKHMSKVMTSHTKIVDNRCLFHEEFGGSDSWVLADIEAKAAQKGKYKFAIFNKARTAAKAWFACCDWPEDFTTKYEITASTCPFCGTLPKKNGAWASLFYEQKSMVKFGGFPAVNACPVRDQKPKDAQCPPEPKKPEKTSANCVLHCSNGNCHSHNVDGGCVFDIDWKIPYPTLKDSGTVVKKIVLFKGDTVRIKKADSFSHNIYAFNTVDAAMKCDFSAATQIAMVEETGIGHTVDFDRLTKKGFGKPDNEFAFSCSILCTSGRSTNPDCHCVRGQRLVVKVKDPADGRRCHSHKYTMPAPPAGPNPCPDSIVRRAIESKMLKSEKGECSQMCVPTAALKYVEAMTEAGTCHEAGYYLDAKIPKKTFSSSPSAPPMDLLIKAKPSDEPCHCHSYEEILCSDAGNALYDEHIKEITEYCKGVVAGTDKTCPYNCFQPFEVLHLHYLTCKYRTPHPLFLKVQNTKLCHLATRSKDGSECRGPGSPKTTSTAKASTTPAAPVSTTCKCTAKQQALTAAPPKCKDKFTVIQAIGDEGHGASSCQCAQYCVPSFVAEMDGGVAKGAVAKKTCADAGYTTPICKGTVKMGGWDTEITYYSNPSMTTAKKGPTTTAKKGPKTTAKKGMETTAKKGIETTAKKGIETTAKKGMETTEEKFEDAVSSDVINVTFSTVVALAVVFGL